MITITYKSWFRAKGIASSEEDTLYQLDIYNKTRYSTRKNKKGLLNIAAKEFHEKRKVYFVTIYEDERPINFLELNNDHILVGFLDEKGRIYLQYVFSELSRGRIFLMDATYIKFSDSQGNKYTSTEFSFTPDGKLRISEGDSETSMTTVKTALTTIDVSQNWEDYPEFGHYEQLIRKERIKM